MRLTPVAVAPMLVAVLAAGNAGAGVVPSSNQSHVDAHARAGTVVDDRFDDASVSGSWSGSVTASAVDAGGNVALCSANVSSAVSPDCLSAGGGAGGIASGPGLHTQVSTSLFFVTFHVNEVQEFNADLTIGAGSPGAISPRIELWGGFERDAADRYWGLNAPGTASLIGRIAPGNYLILAETPYVESAGSSSGGTYNVELCFTPVSSSLIGQQPLDQEVPPGVSVDLSLTPNPAPSLSADPGAMLTYTYQWRKNLQPLTDGGRISGATSPRLSIATVVASDSGRYDCVVSDGTIVEPSRQAVLRVLGTTGVGPGSTVAELDLSAPSPNPFRGQTRLRFQLPDAGPVDAGVYDLFGRRVKTLFPLASMAAGEHSLVWDGRGDDDAAVPSGVYFVRLRAGNATAVRRAVLVTPER